MSHSCNTTTRTAIILTVNKMATYLNASASPKGVIQDAVVENIWMDSRKIEPGDLFIALKGKVVDGHDYVEAALKQGAVAAIVAESEVTRYSSETQMRLIVVNDPLTALQNGAREYRKELNIPIVAVTGSNGKTSTAHFITEILSITFTVGTTYGNWNNHIGVPLSLFRMNGLEDIAVLEIGANHLGEVAALADIIMPDMGVITNVGYAHVGEFGSIENTQSAKFELAQAIEKIGGQLFLNGDDRLSVEKNMALEIPAIYYGTREHNSAIIRDLSCNSEGCYSFTFNEDRYSLNVAGKHFVYNLMPALVLATQLNIEAPLLVEKVPTLKPADMRGVIEVINGVSYIVDCYNANPSSMSVALELLADYPAEGNRIAVLGDMKELGQWSESLHEELGTKVTEETAKRAVSHLIAVGEYAESVRSGAERGEQSVKITTVKTSEPVAQLLRDTTNAGDVVLLKGSRGVALETVLVSLREGK